MLHRQISRRSLLKASGLIAAVAYAGLPGCSSGGIPRFSRDPFTLGIASGEPAPDGFVLWTRLAPEPYHAEALGEADIPVGWEIAEDEQFRNIVQRGTVPALAQWAHSVHLEVNGLRPDRWYWYRFRVGTATSPVGRTRTLPAHGAPTARWRLACASCQHFEQGYFTAYRHMLGDNLDLVFHVGDYIYERAGRPGRVRQHEGPEAKTLAGYRRRYAQYKQDPDLQAAHAAYPWVVTWDDHEVQNDYAGTHAEDGDPGAAFLKRRAAAYQAYYEHMPLRRTARPDGQGMRLYRAFSIGNLAGFHVLDERQYRDGQVCPSPQYSGGQLIFDCAERLDPRRTLLGAGQERWLSGGLGASRAHWNGIAQQLLMAQLKRPFQGGYKYWSDGWDGYPAARARLLSAIRERKVPNVVTLGGDVHSFWVSDLKVDFDDPASPAVATGFTGSSITSQAGSNKSLQELLPANPHIRFMDSRYRGYLRAEITPQQWRTDLQIVEDVTVPNSPARTLASFVVESGRPGAVRV